MKMQKIMIVEDDEVIALAIQKHLETWNYEVEVVDDFEHVLDLYLQKQPELILLDISLPFYNGYHWCEQIRKVSSVPIIFISSANENMNIVMAISMGADDFITKPYNLQILVVNSSEMINLWSIFVVTSGFYGRFNWRYIQCETSPARPCGW